MHSTAEYRYSSPIDLCAAEREGKAQLRREKLAMIATKTTARLDAVAQVHTRTHARARARAPTRRRAVLRFGSAASSASRPNVPSDGGVEAV
jgi:hypothetical protein